MQDFLLPLNYSLLLVLQIFLFCLVDVIFLANQIPTQAIPPSRPMRYGGLMYGFMAFKASL